MNESLHSLIYTIFMLFLHKNYGVLFLHNHFSVCNIHWPIVTNLGQDDYWVCQHMSRDFHLHLTFDLDIGVNEKFGEYISFTSSACFNFRLKDVKRSILKVNNFAPYG